MEKVKGIVCKAGLLFYLLFVALFQKRVKDKSGRNLLIYSGGLGDGILDIQSIQKIVQKFSADEKPISILAAKSNCEIFDMFISPKEADIIPCSFLTMDWKFPQKWRSYREIVKTLRQTRWERIIVRFNRDDINALLIFVAIPAVHKISFLFSERSLRKRKQFVYWLINCVSDKTIELSGNQTQMQLSREFAKYIGVKQYPIKVAKLPEKSVDLIMGNPYITIAVDARNLVKRWSCENYVELIRCLLADYSYEIVLVGDNVPIEENAIYDDAFGLNDRVKNMIGKTTLYEWIKLIRDAQIHIAADSSSIHVAASVGTQAICLTGVWDNHRFFPYQIDEETPGTVVPIPIYRNDVDIDLLQCRNCNAHGNFGWGNKECFLQCRFNQPCLCLSKIRVPDVIEVIKRYVNT